MRSAELETGKQGRREEEEKGRRGSGQDSDQFVETGESTQNWTNASLYTKKNIRKIRWHCVRVSRGPETLNIILTIANNNG